MARRPPPAQPVASRASGPLLLLATAALLAIIIAGIQLLALRSPGAQIVSAGGRHASARTGADGAPAVRSLDELRSQYGEPPDATEGRVRIPSISVDAPLGKRTVGPDGVMHDPSGPADIVWYDFATRPALGGKPGGGRNAVFAGHVDRNGPVDYAGVHYTGPGVFFQLDRLSAGDVIEVTAGGRTLRYAVIWIRDMPVESDWEQLFSGDVLGDSITLVTCGGDFDYDTDEYSSRTVVRAVRG